LTELIPSGHNASHSIVQTLKRNGSIQDAGGELIGPILWRISPATLPTQNF
jgi:hypothetical protein